jgi:phospholipid/cholesterol/gamma-HCH transport system substrate-binding protein
VRLFSTEAKVGVVVLGALASLTWLTFQIGEFRFRDKGYLIEAVFTTVSGLEEDAKVRMAGVLVGSVDSIFLREGRAHAILRLDDGVVVREDSVVAVASIGILSERYVEITSGSQTARALPEGAVVEGRVLTDLDQMMAELSRTSVVIGDLAGTTRPSGSCCRTRTRWSTGSTCCSRTTAGAWASC